MTATESSLLSWERGLKYIWRQMGHVCLYVAPLVGAWIEIIHLKHKRDTCDVAPLVGAWIEIFEPGETDADEAVAPLVGAWIEMYNLITENQKELVAPLVGAWIEIKAFTGDFKTFLSLLSWERGLKSRDTKT